MAARSKLRLYWFPRHLFASFADELFFKLQCHCFQDMKGQFYMDMALVLHKSWVTIVAMIEDKKSFVHVTPHLKQQLAFFSSHALVVSRFTTCDSIAYHLFSTRRYDLKKSCPCPLVVPFYWTKAWISHVIANTALCQLQITPFPVMSKSFNTTSLIISR